MLTLGDEDLSTALHHASTVEGGHLLSPGRAGAAGPGRETTGRQRVTLKSSTESTSSTAHVSQSLHEKVEIIVYC